MKLKNAHVTQITGENGKGDWVVYNRDEEIYRLPKDMSEKHIMSAIHMGRKFEGMALKTGIERERSRHSQEMDRYRAEMKALADENIKLSNYIKKLENGTSAVN